MILHFQITEQQIKLKVQSFARTIMKRNTKGHLSVQI